MKERAAEKIERIDRILEGGDLDEQVVDDVIAELTPGDSSPWPDLRVVLHVAEHPAVADDLRVHEVPERLESSIAEALEANLPLLGLHTYGPTYKLIELARTRLEQEGRKFERVAEHLAGLEAEEAAGVLSRYLDTDPAPMFVQRMRQIHGELFDRLPDEESPVSLWEACVDSSAPAQWLETAPDDDAEAVDAVRAWLDELAVDREQVGRALASGEAADQRLAGALMAWRGHTDLVPAAIREVTEGSEAAPQLAVFVGLTAPERARTRLSQFLAEVSWQNPELPDAEMTEARIRAILSARSVLPHLDSPLPEMAPDELPSTVPTEEMARLPERVSCFWEFWRNVNRKTSES